MKDPPTNIIGKLKMLWDAFKRKKAIEALYKNTNVQIK
jgi:hypothetical protein